MNTEKGKTNEAHKIVLNLSPKLEIRNTNKHAALQNLPIHYIWKNIRKQYKKNKRKIIAPTWNDEFKLPGGSYSVSDILDYIEFIIKTHETLIRTPPIHVYINRINNKLVPKIKDGYNLELQTTKTMKLFASTKKVTDKSKNGEKHQILK